MPGIQLLITGSPGIGKTTLIHKLFNALKHLGPVGFYTAEIREAKQRKGFRLIGLDGSGGILSHVNINSPFRVGRYGVDVDAFEAFLAPIPFLDPATPLLLIDEIGKMECFSIKFNMLLEAILDSDKTLVATIAQKGGGSIARIKQRLDITLLEMTLHNREAMFGNVLNTLKATLPTA
jgi:nucleoside-triphosphatase